MKRKKNSRSIIGYLLLAAISLAATYFSAPVVRSVLIHWTPGFKPIGNHVYVDANLSEARSLRLQSEVLKAKDRVIALYGSYSAAPVIIATEDPKMLRRYGTTSQGTAVIHVSLPGSYIVLGPNGMNVDVIAHEMGHAELAKRIGVLKRRKIPVWFDEGLAMQLDDRPKYRETEWVKLSRIGRMPSRIEDFDTPLKFYNNAAVYHYIAAKHEVKQWLDKAGSSGLLRLLAEVKAGKIFIQSYHRFGK